MSPVAAAAPAELCAYLRERRCAGRSRRTAGSAPPPSTAARPPPRAHSCWGSSDLQAQRREEGGGVRLRCAPHSEGAPQGAVSATPAPRCCPQPKWSPRGAEGLLPPGSRSSRAQCRAQTKPGLSSQARCSSAPALSLLPILHPGLWGPPLQCPAVPNPSSAPWAPSFVPGTAAKPQA